MNGRPGVAQSRMWSSEEEMVAVATRIQRQAARDAEQAGQPWAAGAAEVQAKILQTAKDSVARQMAAAPSLFGPSAARPAASGKEAFR